MIDCASLLGLMSPSYTKSFYFNIGICPTIIPIIAFHDVNTNKLIIMKAPNVNYNMT